MGKVNKAGLSDKDLIKKYGAKNNPGFSDALKKAASNNPSVQKSKTIPSGPQKKK